MTSVSAVAAAEIRQNFSAQPSSAGEDPFSLLLDAVTDVSVCVSKEAPRAADRDDIPPQQTKPEADGRQTKRRASETENKEKPKPESSVAPKEAASDEAPDEAEATEADDDGEDVAVDALLALTLGDTQPQTAAGVQISVDVNAAAQTPVMTIATAEIAATAETATAALAAAAATAPELAETQIAQTAQVAAGIKANAKAEIGKAPVLEADAEVEPAFPKISVDAFAHLLKPLKALPTAATQAGLQPVTIEATASIPGRALAQLETLNAALSKHFQLSAAIETDAPASEGQKPIFPGNGALPNLALSMQPTTTVNAQTYASADAARAVPMESLAVEIATRARNGERRFDIRLDPPELGRIDVRLEIDHKGNTSTKLIVERAETLDMLQRDARGLEKALQSAGLKTDAGGLEFSLRQDAQTQQNQPNAPEMRHRPELLAEEEVSAQITLGNASLAAQVRGGVDIRI